MDRLARWPSILAVGTLVTGPVASAPVALSHHAGVGVWTTLVALSVYALRVAR